MDVDIILRDLALLSAYVTSDNKNMVNDIFSRQYKIDEFPRMGENHGIYFYHPFFTEEKFVSRLRVDMKIVDTINPGIIWDTQVNLGIYLTTYNKSFHHRENNLLESYKINESIKILTEYFNNEQRNNIARFDIVLNAPK